MDDSPLLRLIISSSTYTAIGYSGYTASFSSLALLFDQHRIALHLLPHPLEVFTNRGQHMVGEGVRVNVGCEVAVRAGVIVCVITSVITIT